MPPPQQNKEAPKNANSELDFMIMSGVFLLFGYILFAILVQYSSWIARYIYYPIVAPVWYAGENMGTTGSFLMLAFYSLIAYTIWALRKFVWKKEGSMLLMTFGSIFLTFALIEIVVGHKGSFLTSHIPLYCNPSEPKSFLYILTCQNSAADIAANGILPLMIATIFPNLLIGAPALAELIGAFFRLPQHPKAKATTVYSVRSLIKAEKHLYPHLLICDKIDLNEVDGRSGQLRLMDDGRRLCFEHDLIDGFAKRPSVQSIKVQGEASPEDIDSSIEEEVSNDLVPVINPKRFEQLMLKQLGIIYSGVETLTPAQIILLAINLPRCCSYDENIAKAFWMIDQIDRSQIIEEIEVLESRFDALDAQPNNLEKAKEIEKIHVERIAEVQRWVAEDIVKAHSEEDMAKGLGRFPKLEEYKRDIEFWLKHEMSQSMLEQHAYVNTFLYRVLKDAKRLGVCQPSNFRWLKFYDRATWAIVQNVDRPSAFAENIATVSHYMIERKENTSVYLPMIQAAYNGLVKNINSYKYTDAMISAWREYHETGNKRAMFKQGMISKEAVNG